MDKIYFITYGDKRFRKSKKRLLNQTKVFKFYKAKAFGFNDISKDFIHSTKPYIESEKGGGYWLWKPYFLHKVFDEMDDGDILLYLDAGCELNINGKNRLLEYIKIMDNNQGVLSFSLLDKVEKSYTNDDVFKYFQISSSNDIYNSCQMIATCFILRKNNLTRSLIKDFYNIALRRPDLFTDIHNNKTQRKDFIDHRHDQSIFSVLRKKYGLKAIADETWNNDYSLMEEYPFWAKRIRDKAVFSYRLFCKIKRLLLK